MPGYEANQAMTTHPEMLAWLAADLGVDPSALVGYVIVIAMRDTSGENMTPHVRSNLGNTTAAYLMAAAQGDLLYMAIADPAHPDHSDVCPLPPEAHDDDDDNNPHQ